MPTKSRTTTTAVRIILYLAAAIAITVAAWEVDWRLGLLVLAVICLIVEWMISPRPDQRR